MAPITKHSLSEIPWLSPSLGPLKYRAEATPATPERIAERRRADAELTEYYDVADELEDSDREDDDEIESLLSPANMLRLPNFAEERALDEQRVKAGNHTLRCFKKLRTDERTQCSYDIRVRLARVTLPGVGPVVRELRVPASMPLHALADRVLIVAMGYARGEHGYLFHLPSAAYAGRKRPPVNRDIGFWPQDCGTVDITCHLQNHRGGRFAVPAQRVLISDVLREVGDTIRWKYDLGDCLRHVVELVKIHRGGVLADAQGRTVVLLRGQGAGVPENPRSVFDHAKRLAAIARGGRAAQDAINEMRESAVGNWALVAAPGGQRYDPTYFNAELCQRLLDRAADELGGGDYSGAKNVVCFNPSTNLPDQGATGVLPKPPLACAQCGQRQEVLNWCGRCRNVAYCNVECQRQHWVGGHKHACVAVVKPAAESGSSSEA